MDRTRVRLAVACLLGVAVFSAPVWAVGDVDAPAAPVTEPVIAPMTAEQLSSALYDMLDDGCLSESDALASIANGTSGQNIETIVAALRILVGVGGLCDTTQAGAEAALRAAETALAAADPTGAGPQGPSPFSSVGVPGGAGGASYLG